MKLKKLLSFIIAISMISSAVVSAADFGGLSGGGGAGIPGTSDGGDYGGFNITITPKDALVKFYDAQNAEIESSDLVVGTEYTYTASRYGYKSEVETVTLEETLTIELEETAEFTAYGKNADNIAVTDIALPTSGALKWEQQISDSETFSPTVTEPVFINDGIYLVEGNRVVKRSPEDGSVIAQSVELAGEAAYYGINTLTVGDGMIFVPVDGGVVQAIDAESLESLWISQQFGNNVMTPLKYRNGKLYGGATAADFSAGEFFCIDITDEDPRTADEVKNAVWMTDVEDGFYCSGAYVSDSVVVFGSDSGTVFVCNAQTGEPVNSQTVSGAIRSSISYADGNIYFTSTTGYFHKVPLTEEGLGDVVSIELSGTEATSTPAIYDGLAYVGVKKEDAGAVVIIDVEENTVVAEVEMPGYPQKDVLISTNGGTYAYATYNKEPGGIYRITVEKTDDGVEASGADLFVPEHEQYCISNITFDNDGNLYYKNDSGYLFAVCQAEDSEDNSGENLETVKSEAKQKLHDKFSIFQKSDYSDGNYGELKGIYDDAVEQIATAENTDEIEELLTAALDGMFSVSCKSDRRATIYISVEKFNIDQGYIAEPTELNLSKYSTAAQALKTLLKGNLIYSGSLTNGFAVSAVKDGGINADIPNFIKDAPGVTLTNERADDNYLSESDYSDQSSWIYTVNGEIMDVAASDYVVKNGDIIRFQFSLVSGGADIYSNNSIDGAEKLYELADKDELTMMIAKVKGMKDFDDYMDISANQNAYNSALVTAKKPTATQKSVNSAVSDLKNLKEPGTKSSGTSYYPVGGSNGSSSSGNKGTISSVIQQSTVQPVTNTPEKSTEKFTDITDHWAKEYIYKLYEKKIITGRTENTFDPQASLTRAECVVLLSRMAGADVEAHTASGKFADVSDADWFNQAIGWASDNGIVSGMSDTEFAPLAPITREQFTVMLSRFATFAEIDLSPTADEIAFTDSAEFAEYSKEAIGIIQRAGIINGRDDGTFAPRANITRAETAKMLAVVSDK